MCISKMHFFFPFHSVFAKNKLSLWHKNKQIIKVKNYGNI